MFWRKRQPKPKQETASFRQKVFAFWEWYSDNSERLLEAIDQDTFKNVQGEVSDAVNRLWPSFSWVFGPPPEGKEGHSFTISGAGVLPRQILAEYWLSCAPSLPGWTFHASRQPSLVDPASSLGMQGKTFDFKGLWVSPTLDTEREIMDVAVWHPIFSQIEEPQRHEVAFLMLDEILGEFGTDLWLGNIEIHDRKLKDAVPVLELREQIHELETTQGWNKQSPTRMFYGYQLKERNPNALRLDTLAGSARDMKLLERYFKAEGPYEENFLEGSGAECVFISYPSQLAPSGGEVEFRAKMEDALEQALHADKLGELLGGAIGESFSYIDLILYDGDTSINRVVQTLRGLDVLRDATLQFFIKGNEHRRISI